MTRKPFKADNNGLTENCSGAWFQSSGKYSVRGAAGERNSLPGKGLLKEVAARTATSFVSRRNTGRRKSERSNKSASGMTHAEKEGMLSQRQAERAQVHFVRVEPPRKGSHRLDSGCFAPLGREPGGRASGWPNRGRPAVSERGLSAECQGCRKCAVSRRELRRRIKRQVGDRSLSGFNRAGADFGCRACEELAISAGPNRRVHGSTVPVVRC